MLLYELEKPKKRALDRERVLRDQIVAIVDDRLGDRDLRPGLIQAQFGIARSTLYRLAEPWGGLGALIRIRRIDKAVDDPPPAFMDTSDTLLAGWEGV